MVFDIEKVVALQLAIPHSVPVLRLAACTLLFGLSMLHTGACAMHSDGRMDTGRQKVHRLIVLSWSRVVRFTVIISFLACAADDPFRISGYSRNSCRALRRRPALADSIFGRVAAVALPEWEIAGASPVESRPNSGLNGKCHPSVAQCHHEDQVDRRQGVTIRSERRLAQTQSICND